MIKEEYKRGKAIVEARDVAFHDFATQVEINDAMKWTSDYESMVRTIELKQLSAQKTA